MDALRYYVMKKLDLADIQLSVSQAGYESGFQYDPYEPDKLLYVSFKPKKISNYKSYWRWKAVASPEAALTSFDSESWNIVSSIWDNVQSVFWIWYYMAELEDFGLMMKEIMVYHGGYVHFEYDLFDLDNILSIQNYIPKSPDDLLD